MKLTSKQEKFAQEIAVGKSGADAYRSAYNAGGMKAETIHKKASLLLKKGELRGRIEELRQPAVIAVGLTLENHLNRLEELSRAAECDGNYGPAVSAEVSRGKAAGLYTDKIDIVISDKLADRLKAINDRRKLRN